MAEEPIEAEEVTPEEETTPQFVFGVTLVQLPGGEGVKIQPLEGPDFDRMPTISDLLSVAAQLDSHIRAINIISKTQELGQRPRIVKPGGRIQ